MTQWFFGPAIIDRSFKLTGGACELVRADDQGQIDLTDGQRFVTGMACKAVGGKWKGGHDISGHVFLLVLGSMFLLEEVLHVVMESNAIKEERTITMDDGAVKSASVEAAVVGGNANVDDGKLDLGVKVVLGVAGLSIWMLLMTAAYFHTWFEKVSYQRPISVRCTDSFQVHRTARCILGHLCSLSCSEGDTSTETHYRHARSIK